jgi:tetratricopeptide (TPR) repeat protein
MEDLNVLLESLRHSNPRLLEKIMSSSQVPHPNSVQNLISPSQSYDTSMENLVDQLKQMQQLYDSMQQRKGRKAPFIPDHQLIMRHQMQREDRSRHDLSKEVHVMNSSIFDVYYSKVTDLSTLRKIRIDDLLMETWHEGRYLLCCTIVEPYRFNAIMSIVEDETGHITTLSLYNYTKGLTESAAPYLPMNTILLIKEPYFKETSNGAAMVRCDSPSDVIIINYNDDNYKAFKVDSIRNWNSLCASRDRVHAYPCPKTPSDWKTRGNYLFNKGYDKDAACAYSMGISLCEESGSQQDKECENLLKLNRSAAYLRMGRFDDAATDAVCVLDSQPGNIKALFRVAKSYYQLRSFKLALKYYEELAALNPSNEKELLICRQRVQEQETGKYDWKSLNAVVKRSPSKAIRLDAADYFNSEAIEIHDISNEKGRGVFARRGIPPGSLLVVSKAFSICFAEEVKNLHIFQLHLKTRSANRTTQIQLISDIIHKILDSPSLGKSVYQLWSGGYKEAYQAHATNDEHNNVIDFDHIYRICKYNSFSRAESLEDDIKNPKDGSMKEKDGTGLWITSSFFNHSCISNTSSWFLGDLMAIVNTRFIKAGEEVTVSYVSARDSLKDRRKAMQSYNFTCNCELCIMETGLDEKRLDALMDKYDREIAPRIRRCDLRVIPLLERHIESMKKVYAKHSQSQFLFKVIDMMCGLALLYDCQGRMKDSVKIYEEAFTLDSNIRNIIDYVDGREMGATVYISPELELLACHIELGYKKLGNRKKVSKWARILALLKKLKGVDFNKGHILS